MLSTIGSIVHRLCRTRCSVRRLCAFCQEGSSFTIGRARKEPPRRQRLDLGCAPTSRPVCALEMRCTFSVSDQLLCASAFLKDMAVHPLTKFEQAVNVLLGRSWSHHNHKFLPKGGFVQRQDRPSFCRNSRYPRDLFLRFGLPLSALLGTWLSRQELIRD